MDVSGSNIGGIYQKALNFWYRNYNNKK